MNFVRIGEIENNRFNTICDSSIRRTKSQPEDDVKDFITMMRMKLQGRDPNDILNMDQTPIPYSYHSNKTLEVIGSKSVQQRSSTSETKKC